MKGWKPSVPGCDGLTVQAITRMPCAYLEILLNCIFYRGHVPTLLTTMRTTLIPKDEDLEDSSKRYNIVSLDVRKAFDTVSHFSIHRALQHLGIVEGTRSYIAASLTDSNTTIKVGPGIQTRQISIRRGVKQGDPVTPFLFNTVLNELLCTLQSTPGTGGTIADEKIPVLAFADDLLLLKNNDVHLPTILATVTSFFRLRRMSLNAKKSISISVEASGGVCIPRTKPFLRVDNVLIPATDWIQTFRYLDQTHYINKRVYNILHLNSS